MSDPNGEEQKRVIKRYSNRKLYDTAESRYVTLQQIGEMVRRGDDVQVIDNKTKEDKTEATLALILSEDLKNKPKSVPLGTLRTLLQERGDRVLSSLREGPLGRLIPDSEEEGEGGESAAEPAPSPAPEAPPPDAETSSRNRLEALVENYRQTVDQFQANLDERVRALAPGLRPIQKLREEVEGLGARLAAIERHLGLSEPPPSVENTEKSDVGEDSDKTEE